MANIKKDNPEKLATQDEGKQNQKHNMCWITLYTSKHKQHKHDMLPATKKKCSLLQATDENTNRTSLSFGNHKGHHNMELTT